MRYRALVTAFVVAALVFFGVPSTPLAPVAHALTMTCTDAELDAIWTNFDYETMEGYAMVECPTRWHQAQDAYTVWCYNNNPNFHCSMDWYQWLHSVLQP